MRLRPEQHVRRQHDFRDAREKGRRFDCGGFTFWYYRRPAASGPSPAGSSFDPAEDKPAESSASPAPVSAVPPKKTFPPVAGPRVGVIASTAAVGNAVQRNRAKRRLREVFRQQQRLVPTEYDLLLIARRSLNELPYTVIEQKFVEACSRVFKPRS